MEEKETDEKIIDMRYPVKTKDMTKRQRIGNMIMIAGMIIASAALIAEMVLPGDVLPGLLNICRAGILMTFCGSLMVRRKE